MFVTSVLWLVVRVYVVVQIVLLFRLSGGYRLAAALPLLVMVPAAILGASTWAIGYRRWPFLVLEASPIALFYLSALGLFSPSPVAVERPESAVERPEIPARDGSPGGTPPPTRFDRWS